ncbi:MAG: anion permease [Kiritimatiellales bacterium]|nr:anion permease [Kiritimatiellales bacterium]
MNKRWMGALVCVVVGIFLAVANPITSLSPLGHSVLMGLLVGVGFWIFQPGKMPFAVASCLVMAIFLVTGVDQKLVFAGFTGDATWILIPATAFGYVLTKTGLGRRVAFLVIKLFKPTYLNMTIAWLIIGLILSAFTPSILIRIAIVMPIAAGCASTLKLEPGSKGNAFILLVAWAMAVVPGSGWLTGSLWGPITLGLYGKAEGLAGMCTDQLWVQAMLLPMTLLTALIVAGLYVALKPGKLTTQSRDAFVKEYEELGPWTRNEKLSAIILVATFVMFLFKPLTGLGAVPVCMGAFFLLFAVQVLEPPDLAHGVAWNLILFLGCVLALPAIFANPEVGVSNLIKEQMFPILSHLGQNPWLFVMIVPLLMFAWRFLDIAWMIPTMALLVSMLPSIHSEFGIHPLVTSCLMIMAGNFAILPYMQPFALMGSALAKERSWTPGQLFRYGMVYLAGCLITLAVSIVYWKATGFIK